MEIDSASSSAKKLWSFLRLAFFMARKSLLSNKSTKLIVMEMNLVLQRGKLLAGKTLANLLHQHSPHQEMPSSSSAAAASASNRLRRQEYEFSCSSSPNPIIFFPCSSSKRRHSYFYFPCISAGAAEEAGNDQAYALMPERPSPALLRLIVESSPQWCRRHGGPSTSTSASPLAAAVEDGGSERLSEEVDCQAEEFIRKFYEQLQAQSSISSPLC
ncbi:hypothetical protein AXF42_Ash011947 [Apostasia shenzhenica]|uniref:Avr9/Cf-9 rapidly elicited protein 146 n=1 Tax=Apostasia shenzhenica TaxID=1088818 RepID=A0A2I0AWA0_9ASPA|nr:hypothetical protein AXF42_Ash011947 [Apostasia shenzhenica]